MDLTSIHPCKGDPDVRHVDCGGQIAISGEGYIQLPEGCGYDLDSHGRCAIDVVQYPVYSGFCMKCKARGDFVRADRKPKKIRRLLRRSQGATT